MEIKFESSNTEQTVSFAGQELCRYLEQMLEGEEGVFSVFLTVDSREGADSFSVNTGAFGGTITGNNPRSVLLGVYDYLQYLGCRF